MSIHIERKKSSNLIGIIKIYVLIFLLWSIYRIFFHLPEWFDEMIAKPLLWIVPIFIFGKKVILFSTKTTPKTISNNILIGLSIGILYFILYTLFSSIRLGFPVINPDHLPLGQMGLQFIIACGTGFVEELVFRRYFLEEFLKLINDRVISNLLTTVLFTLIHLPVIIFVYKYSLSSTISYLSLLAISGFIYGLVYLRKKSLFASSATHAVWNFLGTIIR